MLNTLAKFLKILNSETRPGQISLALAFSMIVGFTAMKKAETKIKPVLRAFNDRVLFLKHNLNAGAIASLRKQKKAVETDIKSLVADMNKSISEADRFIKAMSK